MAKTSGRYKKGARKGKGGIHNMQKQADTWTHRAMSLLVLLCEYKPFLQSINEPSSTTDKKVTTRKCEAQRNCDSLKCFSQNVYVPKQFQIQKLRKQTERKSKSCGKKMRSSRQL